MATVIPPDEIFSIPPSPLVETQGGATLDGWIRLEHPKEGGMLSYYTDHPFPFKGQPYEEAAEANNIVKKLTLGLLMSLVPQRYWLEKILFNYCRLADYTNRRFYLKKEYYKIFGSELWNVTYFFFRYLGISSDVSYRLGRVICNLFEWDDAYRYRIQDLLSESSKENWINPKKEIKRLLILFNQREKLVNAGEVGLDIKFRKVIKLTSLLFLIPKFKKAFVFSVKLSDFKKLQFDDTDRYWCNQFQDYDYFGENFVTRIYKFIRFQNIHAFNKKINN